MKVWVVDISCKAQDHGVVCGPGGYVDYLLLPGRFSGCGELGI